VLRFNESLQVGILLSVSKETWATSPLATLAVHCPANCALGSFIENGPRQQDIFGLYSCFSPDLVKKVTISYSKMLVDYTVLYLAENWYWQGVSPVLELDLNDIPFRFLHNLIIVVSSIRDVHSNPYLPYFL